MLLFHEKFDHTSRNEKDGTIKITLFCSEECAESIGTVRWTLATSNVEIIDPIYIFQNCQFSTKKVIFLENGPSDRAQNWCVDARDDFGKSILKRGIYKIFFFLEEKCQGPPLIVGKTM